MVVLLFQKRNRRVCDKYRSVTLLSLSGKDYSKVLEGGVQPIVDLGLKSNVDLILVVEQPTCVFYFCKDLGRGWEFAQPVYMCFTDLEKAYTRFLRRFCGRCCGSMG